MRISRSTVPVERAHEHAVSDSERRLRPGEATAGARVLYYLGTQRADLTFASIDGARVLLIGGVPFPETILMWWNFVARTPEEIRTARDDWEATGVLAKFPPTRGQFSPGADAARAAQPRELKRKRAAPLRARAQP